MSAENERNEIAQDIFENKCGRFPTFAVMEGEADPRIPTKLNVPLARAWARAAAEQSYVEADVFLEERSRRYASGAAGAKPKRAKKPIAPPPDPNKGPVIT
jgi:hypothetical protein